jgi:5-(carboxyamino)imidazole ribonucleotide synthase
MMARAAKSLGIDLIVQTPDASDPAVAVATEAILASIQDTQATAELAAVCDVVTFENEFVNLEALSQLEQAGIQFRPSLDSLAPLLDKYHQRGYFKQLGLPTPGFKSLEVADLQKIDLTTLHVPIVLKARRHGYDGQGTFVVRDRTALQTTLEKLGRQPILIEEFVPFERELAVMAARSASGEIVVYPVVETQQEHQVCRRVLVPAHLEPQVTAEIKAIAHTLLTSLNAVGIFGIELFLTSQGNILVNEVSPRTHNSGHYTLDASETSQFEQHLRAVCGLPLGSPDLICPGAVMVNLLGYESAESNYPAKRQQLATIPQAHVYWYGKTQARPGRKLGHVTVLLDDPALAQTVAGQIEALWYPN